MNSGRGERFLAGRRGAAAFVLLAVTAGAAVAPLRILPAGPDTYAHLIWTYGAMRCIAAGALPVWLPDLNAGFGSPGLRFYSPLPATVAGAIGAFLGSAGAGMRVVETFAAATLLGWLLRRGGTAGWLTWGWILVSPIVAYSLFGRGALAEFCAIPLIAFLVEGAVRRTFHVTRDGVVLALLWLVHSPSAVMTGVLMAAAAVVPPRGGGWRRVGGAAALALGLTAWHWLPLAAELRGMGRAAGLTTDIYVAADNVLGSARAHALGENIWLGWCAVGLLVAVLVGGLWRREPRRALLVALCVWFASPLSAWVWHPASPLRFLLFPWRFLLPATLLAVRGFVDLRPGRRVLAAVAALAPLALAPFPFVAPDPGLEPSTGWRAAGQRVFRTSGGNPFLVDLVEHRPPSWDALGRNLVRFGDELVVVDPPAATLEVDEWSPLRRRVSVDVSRTATVSLRMLEYDFWEVTVDGAPAGRGTSDGVLGAVVPPGRHDVAVSWRGDPLARVGLAVAAATALAALGSALWRRP